MTILIAFLVFALAVLLMSLGVIFSGRRIQGSCGGLANIPGLESDCGGACRHHRPDAEAACRLGSGSAAEHGRRQCARRGSRPAPASPGARNA